MSSSGIGDINTNEEIVEVIFKQNWEVQIQRYRSQEIEQSNFAQQYLLDPERQQNQGQPEQSEHNTQQNDEVQPQEQNPQEHQRSIIEELNPQQNLVNIEEQSLQDRYIEQNHQQNLVNIEKQLLQIKQEKFKILFEQLKEMQKTFCISFQQSELYQQIPKPILQSDINQCFIKHIKQIAHQHTCQFQIHPKYIQAYFNLLADDKPQEDKIVKLIQVLSKGFQDKLLERLDNRQNYKDLLQSEKYYEKIHESKLYTILQNAVKTIDIDCE